MANLIAYNNDGLEIYIDKVTGETFASISSYARMSGLSKQAISNRSKTVNSQYSKRAEIVTTTGNKTVNLLTEDIVAEWIIKDNPTIAVQFLKLGIRKFMHTLAGYSQPQSLGVSTQLPPITSAKLVKLTNEITTITNRIDELKQLLSQEELKLQDAKFAQVKEAEVYKAANPEALKAALLCDEILKKAKQDNPFRRN